MPTYITPCDCCVSSSSSSSSSSSDSSSTPSCPDTATLLATYTCTDCDCANGAAITLTQTVGHNWVNGGGGPCGCDGPVFTITCGGDDVWTWISCSGFAGGTGTVLSTDPLQVQCGPFTHQQCGGGCTVIVTNPMMFTVPDQLSTVIRKSNTEPGTARLLKSNNNVVRLFREEPGWVGQTDGSTPCRIDVNYERGVWTYQVREANGSFGYGSYGPSVFTPHLNPFYANLNYTVDNTEFNLIITE